MKMLKEISAARGKLIYRLTETLTEETTAYGITVINTLFGEEETAQVRYVTTDFDFAERLLYILADNTVLPSTLREVVEEYITEYFTVLV